MTDWFGDAARYSVHWLEHQRRVWDVPGCVLAIARDADLVSETAFGIADIDTRQALTARHRFRVASHSKTFTAVGILLLCEQGRLDLDEPVGKHLNGIPAAVHRLTLRQLLSHSAGLLRDGVDAPHWQNRAAFFGIEELQAELKRPSVFQPATRFKYSNIGYSLAGMVIEAVTGEKYAMWMRREVIDRIGLRETTPDLPARATEVPFATGHGSRLPHGKRYPIDCARPTNALMAATGFTSTAGDLARFFASLDSAAETGVLNRSSREAMSTRAFAIPMGKSERWYGLGTLLNDVEGHECLGHMGSFPGQITRTLHVADFGLTVCVLTNAIDAPAREWAESIVGIFGHFHKHGAANDTTRSWFGRWWTIWASWDLVPAGNTVYLVDTAAPEPFCNAGEIHVKSATEGVFARADGITAYGEPVIRTLDNRGKATRIQIGGNRYVREEEMLDEVRSSNLSGRS